ncbi:MAG: MFS transporter [Elusimicrobia bacterium]|nr:MFS transporter [Elusimicrobiota bacterium]
MNKKMILALTSLTAFINPFMMSSINVAIMEIEKSLGTSSTSTSWIITAYVLSTAVSLIPSGKLADIFGKKRIYVIGIFIFSLSSFFCAVSNNFTLIIISRIIQGISGGMFLATQTAILTHIFPKEKRGRVLGINVSCVYIGLSVGPFIGGFITERYGWNKIFLLTAVITFLASVICYYKIKFEDIKNEDKFNFKETVVYSIFIISFIYGISKINTTYGLLIFTLSIFLFYYTIKIESTSENPLVDIKSFLKNTVFIFSNAAALINYTATNAITFFLSIYLQSFFQINPKTTGLVLLIQPAIMTIISPIAGRLSDRKEPHIISSIGMTLITIALLMLTFINSSNTILYIIILLVIAGIGFGLFTSPNTNAVMSSVAKKDYSKASSILATSRVLGQTLSMGISTLVISVYMSDKSFGSNSKLLLQSMRISFVIFSILSFAGIFFSFKRGKIHSIKEKLL